MQQRLNRNKVYQLQPVLVNALVGLGEKAAASFEPGLTHLVKLRASQINGCAFCQHMHAAEARQDGENQQRLDVLAAWHETGVFSEQERAALHWTETLTRLAGNKVTDEDYQVVASAFSTQQIVDLTALIITINAWNRVAVGFNFQPEITEG
jgi:AhpD family alkylhydroperoxidase